MKKIIVIAGIILLIGLIGWVIFGGTNQTFEVVRDTPEEEPLDVTLDFFSAWLTARNELGDGAFTSDVIASGVLSDAVRARIQSTADTGGLDPVLCQPSLPPRVGGRELFVLPEEAQIMVLSRGLSERAERQSIVTLRAINGAWVITDISCATGETAPEREFTFEREGFLLKSVPPPLNPDFWHLVFEENGVNGHTAPLSFTPDSLCITPDGASSTCDPATFSEPTKVLLKGEMTETGVTVARVEFE